MTTLARARFSQLVLPRLDEGYRLAHWLTGNVTDAEDVMQEACLRAYHKRSRPSRRATPGRGS
jgi:DNA-directed RNA polymerase specialized sigma24 family protein